MLPRTLAPAIAIETVLDADGWWAMTEPGQLEVAILNLAINARDAMSASGKLIISTQNIAHGNRRGFPDLNPGDYVMISVADTGTGMSEEVRARAFEPFFTTKGTGEGTGLGLSMVYGFAKQSGGTITIDSELGQGTTFRIYLPRAPHQLPTLSPQLRRVPHLRCGTLRSVSQKPSFLREIRLGIEGHLWVGGRHSYFCVAA